MALLYFSGWEDNSLVLEGGYGTYATLDNTMQRSGSYCLKVRSELNGTLFHNGFAIPFVPTVSEIYFQWCAMMSPDIVGAGYAAMKWVDAAGNILGGANFSTGTYIFYTGGIANNVFGGGTYIGQTIPMAGAGSWTVFELYLKIASSGGRAVVKQNGTTVIDFTGDTQSGGQSSITQLNHGNFCINGYYPYIYFDDIVVCDTTGSYMNSWPSALRVTRLAPTGAGNYAQWTPSTGANWECVNEIPPSDTDYVASSTTGQKDSYAMADCAVNVYDIKALVSRFYGSGGGTIKSLLRIGGADYLGSVINLPSTGKVDDIRYLNPANSQPFTAAVVNGLESGMEKQ